MAQQPLPMTPTQCLREVIEPTMRHVLPCKFNSPEAVGLLLAILQQESELRTRAQRGNGPAHGLAQFERSGVRGVLMHPSSRPYVIAACSLLRVAPTVDDIHTQLEFNDTLAVVLARLLLFTDSHKLPALGNAEAGWVCYLHNWRPGAAKDPGSDRYNEARARWSHVYALAMEALSHE